MNFIGRMGGGADDNDNDENQLQRDARALLERVGAWDEFGATGWGADGTSPIFHAGDEYGRPHRTDAGQQARRYYATKLSPALFDRVSRYYEGDYEHPHMKAMLPVINFTAAPEQ